MVCIQTLETYLDAAISLRYARPAFESLSIGGRLVKLT
jgi:hypothetical protein